MATTTTRSLTPDAIRHVALPSTRGHSLGLDEDKVRQFLDLCARAVEERDQEIDRLRRRVIDPQNQDRVQQAVALLTKAQLVADQVVAEAQAFSNQLTSEARANFDQARERAHQMVTELTGFIELASQRITEAYDEHQREDSVPPRPGPKTQPRDPKSA